MNSLEKASWIAWSNSKVRDMESFIRTWPYESCSNFELGMIKFDFSKSRTRCKGGIYYVDGIWVPGINIAMHNYTQPTNVYRFYEYASYDADPVIGGFYSDNIEHRIIAVLCHEMAHAVQYWHKFYHKIPIGKPHGEDFKKHYYILRQVYLNNILPNQNDTGIRYRALKKIAITQELGPIRRAS